MTGSKEITPSENGGRGWGCGRGVEAGQSRSYELLATTRGFINPTECSIEHRLTFRRYRFHPGFITVTLIVRIQSSVTAEAS